MTQYTVQNPNRKRDGTFPIKRGQTNDLQFDSWEEYLELVKEPPKHPDVIQSSITGPEGFTGTSSYEEAVQLAVEGWPEGAEAARELYEGLFEGISQTIDREEWRHTVEGGAGQLDIGRYLQGVPDCWIAPERIRMEGDGNKLIRIHLSAGASASILKQVIESRGAAIAALAELLEFGGKSVEVELGFYSYYRTTVVGVTVVVKKFDQPLDLNRLAFALSHPSSLRRLEFRLTEHFDKWYQEAVSVGYGRPHQSPIERQRASDIYIGPAHGNDKQWKTEASTRRYVIGKLKAQGIKFKEEGE